MIKNQCMISPASLALAAMSLAQSGVNFLHTRQQAISLQPIKPAPNTGYVWRRVFLKGRPWPLRSKRRER